MDFFHHTVTDLFHTLMGVIADLGIVTLLPSRGAACPVSDHTDPCVCAVKGKLIWKIHEYKWDVDSENFIWSLRQSQADLAADKDVSVDQLLEELIKELLFIFVVRRSDRSQPLEGDWHAFGKLSNPVCSRASQLFTCAFPQRCVSGQPFWTALLTFSPKQESTGITACAETFTETGMALVRAPCRPMQNGTKRLYKHKSTKKPSLQDTFLGVYWCRCWCAETGCHRNHVDRRTGRRPSAAARPALRGRRGDVCRTDSHSRSSTTHKQANRNLCMKRSDRDGIFHMRWMEIWWYRTIYCLLCNLYTTLHCNNE